MNTIIFISIIGVLAMISEFIGLKKIIYPVIIASLAGAIGYNIHSFLYTPYPYQLHYGMMLENNYSVVFTALLLLISLFWFLISRESYASGEFNQGDHYALILFSTVGGLLLASFTNMTMLFLGIEILSIPLYILAGSKKNNLHSIESSIKYFILGSFATGIMLLGITLIYGAAGSFDFTEIANYAKSGSNTPLFYTGIILLTISFAFKISAVPFHFWVPDVYTGAPTFITGFMSTFVKVAAFAGFYHLMDGLFETIPSYLSIIFIGVSALTILAGNITAAYQTNTKRLLAYSGISQAGYMLMIFPVIGFDSVSALLVYLTGYAIANLPAFYVIYKIEQTNNGEATIDQFKGLAKSNPLLAFVMALSLISLAGIPPAAGFFGKFYLFTQVLKTDNICLVLIGILGSLISVYYYFKIIISMYGGVKEGEQPVYLQSNAFSSFVLACIALLIVLIGILPEVLIHVGLSI